MKISIITVVYNNCATILDAINSVKSQSFSQIEHIIVDGSSTDGTLEIIKNNSDKISKFISGKDSGIYDAMNKGISLATGDIIGILNSDDFYFDSDVLFDVFNEFNNDPSLDVLYGNIVYVNKDNTDLIKRKWISHNYYKNYFENGNVPPHPSLFLKRSVYENVGFFNLEYKLAADYDFMLRVFKKFNFKHKYIDRMMVKMRLGGATNSSWKNIYKGNLEILSSWRQNRLKIPLFFMFKRIFKRIIQFI